LHKLNKSKIAKQIAIVTDELNEMFDVDEDDTPLDDDDNTLTNQIVHLDNYDYDEDE
jgi:hypothetical protein